MTTRQLPPPPPANPQRREHILSSNRESWKAGCDYGTLQNWEAVIGWFTFSRNFMVLLEATICHPTSQCSREQIIGRMEILLYITC